MTELAFPFLLLPAPLITAGGGGGGAKEMLRIELSLSSNANALFFVLGIASMELLLTETSSYDMRVLRSLFMRRRTALGLALWRRLSSCIRSLTPTADELICRMGRNLKGDETHAEILALATSGGREEVADEEPDGADEGVAEPFDGVDLDLDGGGVALEELVVDAEHEFIVPRGVVAAVVVHGGGESAGRVEAHGGVRLHFLGHGFQVLGGHHVYFQQLEGFHESRHRWNEL
nr:hypothetical protein CEY00_Acc25353 [Ipomoea batatas]